MHAQESDLSELILLHFSNKPRISEFPVCRPSTGLQEMALKVEDIVKSLEVDASKVERVAHRKSALSLVIVEPDPSWPECFARAKARITSALGDTAVSVNHVGSTSVPGLPAKAVIDVDLTVQDIDDEAAYVPALEKVGFHFLLREPAWHGHRFFVDYEPTPTNLHVWGRNSPEAERHRIFTDHLKRNKDDRDLYERVKREASKASIQNGEGVGNYTDRKNDAISQILQRAFKDLGYV